MALESLASFGTGFFGGLEQRRQEQMRQRQIDIENQRADEELRMRQEAAQQKRDSEYAHELKEIGTLMFQTRQKYPEWDDQQTWNFVKQYISPDALARLQSGDTAPVSGASPRMGASVTPSTGIPSGISVPPSSSFDMFLNKAVPAAQSLIPQKAFEESLSPSQREYMKPLLQGEVVTPARPEVREPQIKSYDQQGAVITPATPEVRSPSGYENLFNAYKLKTTVPSERVEATRERTRAMTDIGKDNLIYKNRALDIKIIESSIDNLFKNKQLSLDRYKAILDYFKYRTTAAINGIDAETIPMPPEVAQVADNLLSYLSTQPATTQTTEVKPQPKATITKPQPKGEVKPVSPYKTPGMKVDMSLNKEFKNRAGATQKSIAAKTKATEAGTKLTEARTNKVIKETGQVGKGKLSDQWSKLTGEERKSKREAYAIINGYAKRDFKGKLKPTPGKAKDLELIVGGYKDDEVKKNVAPKRSLVDELMGR